MDETIESLAPSMRARVAVGEDGCWLWKGASRGRGYGHVKVLGKRIQVHRYVWQQFRGEIPAGHVLDHQCRHRDCLNPAHLRIVTPRVNTLENSGGLAAENAQKKLCPKCSGEYSYSYRSRTGAYGRYCKPCTAARIRAFEAKQGFRRPHRKTVRQPSIATCENTASKHL